MATSTSSFEENFSSEIQALPQELQNTILNLALTTEPAVEINTDYKPPFGLQISRQHRKSFARAYYHGTVFDVADTKDEMGRLEDYEMCSDWLRSLPPEHRAHIKQIRFWCPDSIGPAYKAMKLEAVGLQARLGAMIKESVVRLRVTSDEGVVLRIWPDEIEVQTR